MGFTCELLEAGFDADEGKGELHVEGENRHEIDDIEGLANEFRFSGIDDESEITSFLFHFEIFPMSAVLI